MVQEIWDYGQFKQAFYRKTGLDLDSYKDRQMQRRIMQLMQREKMPDFRLFYEHLASSPEAMERFLNYLTINTSEFFRDEKVFAKLKEEIFPELLRKFSGTLKIWSAGCSIGAEPYTVAIIFDQLKALGRIQVIATDVDDKALLSAVSGCYNLKQLGKMKEELVKYYFTRDGESYCLKPELKRAISFKRHNLLSDAPFPGCHLILCRNVFIYFKPEAQHFLLRRFSQSLVSEGFLVIGSAEYISNPAQYGLQKRYNTIYQKKN